MKSELTPHSDLRRLHDPSGHDPYRPRRQERRRCARSPNAPARSSPRDRQIVMFPEGTRRPPGAPPDYQTGIALLYRTLGVPVVPVALNSGLFWPRRKLHALSRHDRRRIPAGDPARARFADLPRPPRDRPSRPPPTACWREVAERRLAPAAAAGSAGEAGRKPGMRTLFRRNWMTVIARRHTMFYVCSHGRRSSRRSSPITPRNSRKRRGSATAFIISAGAGAGATCSASCRPKRSRISARWS